MEAEQLYGYWILEKRKESPNETNTFEVFERTYEFKDPSIEVLLFKKDDCKCFHIGIEVSTSETQVKEKFDISSFYPGTYDINDMSIFILEKETMSISKGKLFIRARSDDYYCDETWKKLTAEHEDLKKFLDVEMKNK
ncbi:MAG: hypothetical protein ACOCP4_03515 [Candidatus Woesearchaeota archaeon]